MRLLSLLFTLACSIVSLPTTAAETQNVVFLSSEQLATRQTAIKRVESYLTNLTTVVADFTQVAPDGSLSTGKFFLKRPGKMRWQYEPPTPVLIIASNGQLIYFDRELEQVNYLPIEESIISFMAKKDVRFTGEVGITEFEEAHNAIRITLAQHDKPTEGSLMLEFSDPPLTLRNLVIRDATGQMTTLSLQNAKFGEKLKNDLFIFHDPRKRRRH